MRTGGIPLEIYILYIIIRELPACLDTGVFLAAPTVDNLFDVFANLCEGQSGLFP